MSRSLGHKGWLDIITTAHGTARKVRVVSFDGRSDTGDIPHIHFGPDYRVTRVIDTFNGTDATGHFSTTLKLGAIIQTDTGAGIGPYIAFAFPIAGTLIELSATSIAENASLGAIVGALSVANGSGSYAFSITSDPDNKFDLDGSNLILDGTLDYETATSHEVTIQADNSVDEPIEQTFTINVSNVFEVALAALSLDTSSIVSGSAAATAVGTLQSVTVGSTLSLIDDAGGRFALSSDDIIAGIVATDYDTDTSHNITVRETHADASNSPRDSIISITVMPATSIQLSAATVDEDAATDTVIGTLSVSGGSGSYTFTITSDPDSKFQIANDNELQVAAALDYETKVSHLVTITADNGVDDPLEQEFVITVVNVADDVNAPAIVELIPPDDGTGVLLNSPLIIQFDKPIALGDTVLIRLYKTDGDVLVQEWDEAFWEAVDADSIELLPDPLEEDTAYYVQIASGSIESVDGVAFEGITDKTTWNFTTAEGVPSAFAVGNWSIAAGDEEADVTIHSLPFNGGSAITDIEYRLDGGSFVSTGGTGNFTITGLTNDTEYDVELRAVNASGNGPAGDTKSVTPVAGIFLLTEDGDRLTLEDGTPIEAPATFTGLPAIAFATDIDGTEYTILVQDGATVKMTMQTLRDYLWPT